MNSISPNNSLIKRDGSSRRRLTSSDPLHPSFVKIDERKIEDWLTLAWKYAGELAYFTSANQPAGNWQDFLSTEPAIGLAVIAAGLEKQPAPFSDTNISSLVDRLLKNVPENDIQKEALKEMRNSLREKGTHKAHIGLFLSFLFLFKSNQHQINTLTQKHLDYFYREVLQLKNQKAHPDKAAILLELKSDETRHVLKKDTVFMAGKDTLEKDLHYILEQDFLVTRAKVKSIKNLFLLKEKAQNASLCVHAVNRDTAVEGTGSEPAGEKPGWSLFGSPDAVKADLGFALSSPLLRLAQGEREIILTLSLDGFEDDDIRRFITHYAKKSEAAISPDEWITIHNIFSLALTGADTWLEIESPEIKIKPGKDTSTSALLHMMIKLPLDAGAVVDYDPLIHGGVFSAPWPLCRCLLNNTINPYPYELLKKVTVTHCEIGIQVAGMRDLITENDAGPIDPSKPFAPFGTRPQVGSGFIIGSWEIFQKKLDSLSLHWTWPEDAPESFQEYFREYYPALVHPPEIRLKPQILDQGRWEPLLKEDLALQGKPTDTLSFGETELSPYDSDPRMKDFSSYNPALKRGFIKLKISAPSSPFGHDDYPRVVARKMMPQISFHSKYEFSLSFPFIGKVTKPKIDEPSTADINQPYTPLFTSFSIDYKASQKIDLKGDQISTRPLFAFIHLHPFGQENLNTLDRQDKGIRLLPQYQDEACLYIGLKGVHPPQPLSLLFKTVDHSGDPFEPKTPEVKWSYLSKNRWHPLPLAQDKTHGLLQTGIIAFSIPREATNTNSILPNLPDPDQLHWIRAAIGQGSRAAVKLIGIHAQAATVVFSDRGNDPKHPSRPLPAGSISGLEVNDPKITSVLQPYDSYGGRGPEPDDDFYLRVSQRLRHKDRAVTVWDYEYLVLERFPEVYKVKCLSPVDIYPNHRPGGVVLVVIPHVSSAYAGRIERPAANQILRKKIKQYVKARTSPLVSLRVVNPMYEEVQVQTKVTWKPTCDPEVYQEELKESLKGFLTPWVCGPNDISFSRSITRAEVWDFIMSRPYVQEIISVKLYHYLEGNLIASDADPVEGTTSASILLSHNTHEVEST